MCVCTTFSSSLHSGHFLPPVPSLLLSVSKTHSTSLLSCAKDYMCFCPHICLLIDVVIAYSRTLKVRNKIASWGRLNVHDVLRSRAGKNGAPSHSNRIESYGTALNVMQHLARVYCMTNLHSTAVSEKRISSAVINLLPWISARLYIGVPHWIRLDSSATHSCQLPGCILILRHVQDLLCLVLARLILFVPQIYGLLIGFVVFSKII